MSSPPRTPTAASRAEQRLLDAEDTDTPTQAERAGSHADTARSETPSSPTVTETEDGLPTTAATSPPTSVASPAKKRVSISSSAFAPSHGRTASSGSQFSQASAQRHSYLSQDSMFSTPSAVLPVREQGKAHARMESNASAASRTSAVSGVSFEEIGFDDGPGWTEAPESRLPAEAVVDLGEGGMYARPAGIYPPPSTQSSYPPTPVRGMAAMVAAADAASPAMSDRTATYSPQKVFVKDGDVPLVLGVAVVDFNHLIGPTVEFAHPESLAAALAGDEELTRLLPFLALPDGAHLSEEDYSYFHCTYNPAADAPATDVPANRTLFGISCNRQIAAADLLKRGSDVTRSMVQKAVVVLASQPVFGPVRDRLGVVTRAFFAQRDFGSTQILHDFYQSLESGLEGKAGESAIYMGTSLRELVHKFRHRTLILLKMMLLQKRIMLYGYPVEMLCTYQYSLVSLVPGLLMALKDCGSPILDARVQRDRPTSLKTSDRASLLRYMGLPLHLFGAGAVFQPYLPLQQMDMLQAPSWLVGTTNQIVTQQKDCKYDLLVNIDTMTFEFPDPKVERLVSLTAADRKWMDEIVKTVEDSWNLSEGERPDFLGSDDDLRNRFEEYICAFLSSIKYHDFLMRGARSDIMGVGSEANPLVNFSEAFTASFRTSPAYEMWDSSTDDVIFDLCEPRHPCEGKVNAVSDIGIRLAEGLHDLKLEESLAPAAQAVSSAFAAGSSSLFRAFDGVRSEVNARLEADRQRRAAAAKERSTSPLPAPTPVTPVKKPLDSPPASATSSWGWAARGSGSKISPTDSAAGMTSDNQASTSPGVGTTLGAIGSSVGSFFGSRFAKPPPASERRNSGLRPMSLVGGSAPSAGTATERVLSPAQERSVSGLRPMSLVGGSATSAPTGTERVLPPAQERSVSGLRPMSLVGGSARSPKKTPPPK